MPKKAAPPIAEVLVGEKNGCGYARMLQLVSSASGLSIYIRKHTGSCLSWCECFRESINRLPDEADARVSNLCEKLDIPVDALTDAFEASLLSGKSASMARFTCVGQ